MSFLKSLYGEWVRNVLRAIFQSAITHDTYKKDWFGLEIVHEEGGGGSVLVG